MDFNIFILHAVSVGFLNVEDKPNWSIFKLKKKMVTADWRPKQQLPAEPAAIADS